MASAQDSFQQRTCAWFGTVDPQEISAKLRDLSDRLVIRRSNGSSKRFHLPADIGDDPDTTEPLCQAESVNGYRNVSKAVFPPLHYGHCKHCAYLAFHPDDCPPSITVDIP